MVDSNRLQLILTNYGLTRITEAMLKPGEILALTKIRIGSGDNGKYYDPSEYQTELKGDLGYEFYVYDKQLLEDGLTISFHTIIPEDVSGFDIREVGLYEVVGGEEHLFAIATQQPIVKPDVRYNYFINVNYYMFLKAQDLADLYDRITLDVEHAPISEADLESLLRSFLFAQENLMLQVGKNSELIGYNRPTQIMEKVNENKQNYSYITLYKNFASVLDLIDSPNDVLAYWAFDYSRRETLGGSIVDLSNNKEYLKTNVPLSALPHIYRGFQSMFTFSGVNNYYLPSEQPMSLYDATNNRDKFFTMVFSLEPNPDSYNKTRTIIAKSNKALGASIFEVQETSTGALQVRLYSDATHYITFTTGENVIPHTAHSIVLTYDPLEKQIIAYINSKEYLLQAIETPVGGYTHMNTNAEGTLYGYSCIPVYIAYAGTDIAGSGTPSDYILCDETSGAPEEINGWYISDNEVYFRDNIVEPSEEPVNTVTLYAHSYDDSSSIHTIYTRTEEVTSMDDFLYNSDFTIYDGPDFNIKEGAEEGEYKVVYGPIDDQHDTTLNPSENITRSIYEFEWSPGLQTIYTITDELQSDNYPLYIATTDESGKVSYNLYTENPPMWTIQPSTTSGLYELVYDTNYELGGFTSTQDSEVTVSDTPMTSYITNAEGTTKDSINSSVGLIAIIEKKLEAADARVLALNLCATLGINPFLTGE